MNRPSYPKNKWVINSRIADLYLFLLRSRLRFLSKPMEWLLGTEIRSNIPYRIFMPHPYGVIVGSCVQLGENIVLMQQVTLGGKNPHLGTDSRDNQYPILEEGVYVGAGAKILGNVRVGAWSIVGANAVVINDVPPHSIVGGVPARIIKRSEE